jgi:hypothetical protein
MIILVNCIFIFISPNILRVGMQWLKFIKQKNKTNSCFVKDND